MYNRPFFADPAMMYADPAMASMAMAAGN